MRTNQFQKQDWTRLDLALKPLIKQTLGLPSCASNEYLYGDTESGLFGIPRTVDDCDIARVDTAFKLLTSPDPRVCENAWADLVQVVKTRARRENLGVIEDYLSNCDFDGRSGDCSSIWSYARHASGTLNIRWNTSTAPDISITIGDNTITNRRTIFRDVRKSIRKDLASVLGAKPSQGKTLSCFSKDKASAHFNRTGDYIRFTDWRFIHKARLCCVTLNGYMKDKKGDERLCRVCKTERETLPHVQSL